MKPSLRSRLRSGRWALVSLLSLISCDAPETPPEAAVTRVALRALFVEREHAQSITIWSDTRTSLVTQTPRAPNAAPIAVFDSATLGLPLRIEHATLDTMQAFFKEHPAGWDAWWEAHPSNAGLVEVQRPRIERDSAKITVSRTCGDQCQSTWHIRLERRKGQWHVKTITVLPPSPQSP